MSAVFHGSPDQSAYPLRQRSVWAAKAHGDQVRELRMREARGLRLGDDRRKIFAIQIARARPANDAAGPDTIVISAYGWVDDADSGSHDGARETANSAC
ncbi:hypothetical protein ACLB1M_09060 [Escherichia coli]